jgi:hypothetical protein
MDAGWAVRACDPAGAARERGDPSSSMLRASSVASRGEADAVSLAHAFAAHFASLGYVRRPPLPITSGVDPSVRLVGSTISVLKPLLFADQLPDPGVVLLQPALRARNLDVMLGDEPAPAWSSYFIALGTLSPAARLRQTAEHGALFLRQVLRLDASRTAIRLFSEDVDLLAAFSSERVALPLEIDRSERWRYRHRYGLASVTGRNANFAVRSAQGGLEDVGNLIVIEKEGRPCAVELAFGAFTLRARLDGARHSVETMPAARFLQLRDDADVKLLDALVAAIVLLGEGLRPNATGRGRILRRYLQAVSHLRSAAGWSLGELECLVERICGGRGAAGALPRAVSAYLAACEEASRAGLSQPAANRSALAALDAAGPICPPAGWLSYRYWEAA